MLFLLFVYLISIGTNIYVILLNIREGGIGRPSISTFKGVGDVILFLIISFIPIFNIPSILGLYDEYKSLCRISRRKHTRKCANAIERLSGYKDGECR